MTVRTFTSVAVCLIVLGFVGTAAAQGKGQAPPVGTSANLSADVVEIGRNFRYSADVTVQGAERIQLLRAPDFGRFQVVGQVRLPQFVTVNNRQERRLTVRYTLRSAQTGKFEIAPPTFRVGEQEVSPQAITVEIVERGKAPAPKQPTSNDRFFIDANIAPDKEPFVGEQVTLRYDLYVDGAQMDVTPRASHEPSLDDFWIEELTDRVPKRDQMVSANGRMMRRMPMWTYALFPLRPGPITIEKAEVELLVGAFFRRGQLAKIESDEVELEVRPLPADAPPSFSEGNVGNYQFDVSTDESVTRVGRAFILELRVNGSGQIGRVELPALTDLENARISDVDEQTQSQIRSLRVGGTKVVRYTITPLAEGTLRIPRFKFSYFDPEAEKYRTHESDPIEVKVAPGELPEQAVAREAVTTRDQAADEDLVAALLAGMAPLEPEASLEENPDPAKSPPAYWALVVAAFLGLIWTSFGRRIRTFIETRRPDDDPEEATEAAVAALDGIGAEPAAIISAIRDALDNGYAIPRGLVNAAEVVDACRERGLNTEAAEELAAVLAECEHARYSPGADVGGDLPKRARAALSRIAQASLVLIALATVLVSAAPRGWAEENTTNEVPTAEWGQEVVAAQRQLQDAPNAPDVLFNLGTAAAHSGDYGTARWALEQAAYLAPYSGSIANNLDAVQRIVRLQAIERSRTGRTIDGDEVLFWWGVATHIDPHLAGLGTTFLWLLCAAFVALRRRTDNAAARDAYFVGMVIAVLLAVSATVATAARDNLLRTTEPAVVVADNIDLREGPNEAAKLKRTPSAMVPGTLLRITSRQGDWVKLQWATGAGWTNKNAVRATGTTAFSN